METNIKVGRYINVEFTLRVPDLSETDGPYLLAEDLGDIISRAVHDLDPDVEQAQAIFANLKHKVNELLLFADSDYPKYDDKDYSNSAKRALNSAYGASVRGER